MNITVRSGNLLTAEPNTLLIAPINSRGDWFEETNLTIRQADGKFFHDQVGVPVHDGQTILVKRGEKTVIKGVLFVVDDLKRPLSEVVFDAMKAANFSGYRDKVKLPAIRCGSAMGVVEKNVNEVAAAMLEGLRLFVKQVPNHTIKKTIIVIDNNEKALKAFKQALDASGF